MRKSLGVVLAALVLFASPAVGAEQPALGLERVTQDQITGDLLTRDEIRVAGMKVFTSLFNSLDGYGDGPIDVADTRSPGGRPTLQGNGRFLRINGLDGQGCIECHATISAATFPPTFGVGGVGGAVTNAMFQPAAIDVADLDRDEVAGFDGRFINPPFLFGVGAVELLGIEMTEDLLAIKAQAIANPGVVYTLESKGVEFGTIVADGAGVVDTSGIEGINDDLVVRPLGRKGEFPTSRSFDVGAMEFHFGMQPVESVGENVDGDGDGVTNEILVGEASSLGVFLSTLERPRMEPLDAFSQFGFLAFSNIGCTDCHKPALQTRESELPLRFPEIDDDPRANTYYNVDLTEAPASFAPNGSGGVIVPLFADLKRHDLGPGLAETFSLADEQTNREYTTARLWGVADTAPYLHDGRATTISEAIMMHGGEAQAARDNFADLPETTRDQILEFLRHLKTPRNPAKDLISIVNDDDDDSDDHDSDDHDSGHRRDRRPWRPDSEHSAERAPTSTDPVELERR